MLTQDFTPTCEDTCLDDLRAGHGALELAWSPDGKDIFFAGTIRGTTHVYAVRVAENLLPRRVTDGDCRIYSFSLDRACRTLALGVSDTVEPGDLYLQTVAAQGGKGEVTRAPAADPAQRRTAGGDRAGAARRNLPSRARTAGSCKAG